MSYSNNETESPGTPPRQLGSKLAAIYAYALPGAALVASWRILWSWVGLAGVIVLGLVLAITYRVFLWQATARPAKSKLTDEEISLLVRSAKPSEPPAWTPTPLGALPPADEMQSPDQNTNPTSWGPALALIAVVLVLAVLLVLVGDDVADLVADLWRW